MKPFRISKPMFKTSIIDNNWMLQKTVIILGDGFVLYSLHFAISSPTLHQYATIYYDLRFFELLDSYGFLLHITWKQFWYDTGM